MSKIVFDEATRAKLAGLLPFSPDATDKLKPKIFDEMGIPEEYQPTFKIRTMTNAEIEKGRDANISTDDLFELARKVVVGWENLIDLAKSELIDLI